LEYSQKEALTSKEIEPKKESVCERLFVGHFVNLLLHHMPAAVNKSVLDAWNLLCGGFYVAGKLKRNGAERAGWDKLDFDNACFFLFHGGYHLHLGETLTRFGVLYFAYFLANFVFKISQKAFTFLAREYG
jgi:hypothetical protein